VPERIADAIGQRLRARSQRCNETFRLASVVGREFGIEVLAQAGGVAEEELDAALEETEEARLVGVVPESPGRLRFSHILVRDVIYDGLPATRRLRLHRQVGEALESLHASHIEPHLAELARHFLMAGAAAAEQALDYSARAGDRAARLYGHEEAAAHYERALTVLETTAAGDAGRACELLLSLGEMLSRGGNEAEAKAKLLRAAAMAEEQRRPDMLARAAIAYGGRFAWARASADPALLPLLERALAVLQDGDPALRVRLLARLASGQRGEERRELCVTYANEALVLARDCHDDRLVSVAVEALFHALEGAPHAARGLELTEKLLGLALRTGDPEREHAAHDDRLVIVWSLADRAAVDAEASAIERVAGELRQAPQLWQTGATQTALALMDGRLADAERLIRTTFELGRRAVSFNATVSERIQLFVLRHEQGRLGELADMLADSLGEHPTLPRFACALAHLRLDAGHDLDELLTRANGRIDPEWLFSLVLLADPCARAGSASVVEELRTLLQPYEHMYAYAPSEAAFGSVARALGVLATAAQDFVAAEAHFAMALDVERGMRAHPWIAHAVRGLAESRIAAGRSEAALEPLEEARQRYEALAMAAWVARCDELRRSAGD